MYDTGLKYTFVNDGIHGTETALGMESSMLDSSRFAIRAHEDISDQLFRGFSLQNPVLEPIRDNFRNRHLL